MPANPFCSGDISFSACVSASVFQDLKESSVNPKRVPQMGGAELVARLRAVRPEAAVLFTSGHTKGAVVSRDVTAEAIAYLAKPFSAATLSAKVRDVLDSARTRRA